MTTAPWKTRTFLPATMALAIGLSAGVGTAQAQQDPFAAVQSDPTPQAVSEVNGLSEFSSSLQEGAIRHEKPIHFEAKLTDKGAPMAYGLSWRVFKPIPGPDGKLPLLATAEGGSTDFDLEPGEYFVHVAFGRAGATKKLIVPDSGEVPSQTLVLDAGGMVLNAVSGSDMRIPAKELTFDIYASTVNEDGERGLIMGDVKPGEIVRLNSGTYHVVSNYGDVNATVRADIQIEAGKLTRATIQHKAAKITLKLVSQEGGEAIADTAWSILGGSGDAVSESVGAFPVMILAEGQYTAVARHKDKIYQRDFTVVPGRNQDVEVLLQDN